MDNNVINITVISDIIFDPYFTQSIKACFGECTKIHSIPYGEQNDDKHLTQIEKSDIVVVWLNLESSYLNICDALYTQSTPDQQIIEEVVASCNKLYVDISEHSNAYIIWFLFEDYYSKLPIVTSYIYNAFVDNINIKLVDTLKNGVSFVNLKHIIAWIGITNSYDPKGKYRWNAPYSKALVEAAAKEIHKLYLIEKGITKKCLVLDCDNVLWGGILSEEGIENIKLGRSGLGRSYQDFQRFVLSLYYHGVILAVCSKNDLSDVMSMFREHSEMVLKEEHIACFRANWENKPDNIKWIAETLNIGVDSMAFVDDSPIEVEAVKSILPEVTTILYERDTVYDQLSCFNLKSNVSLEDIEKRNKTYQTNHSRANLKAKYDNYSDYIAALEIKMDIHQALPVEYSRISELTQRTNKCTNGKRYTVREIKERVAYDNVKLYSLSVSDRFSDLGLVGAFEVENDMLTLFCLSCRALGRWIEDKLLEFIATNFKIRTITFISTIKNEDLKKMFQDTFPEAKLL